MNGHPGGANPYANGSTGTGYGYSMGSVPTCEPSRGQGVLVAAAIARGSGGEIYGVRSWDGGGRAYSTTGSRRRIFR